MNIALSTIKNGLKRQLALYRSLYNDRRTPRMAKILLGAAVGYLFFPLDLIPDFIPILGQLDEVIVIPLLVYLALKLIPKALYDEHASKSTSS